MVSRTDAVTQPGLDTPEPREAWFAQDADAWSRPWQRRRARLAAGRGGGAAVPVRAEPDREREAAVGLGGRAAAAPRPDEHHAGRGRGGEPRYRRGLDRRSSSACSSLLNVVLGARQELKARASVDALSKMQVPQAKVVRDGALVARAGRRGGARATSSGRGGRHRAGRRAHPPLGDAGDPGGGAHRGERAGRQGRRHAARRRRRARRPVEHAVPEHVGDPGHRRRWSSPATGMQTQMGQIATMLTSVDADPVAAAEGARLADQGARDHRLDRGRVHRRRRR